jgi:phosphoglycolate phosphatase
MPRYELAIFDFDGTLADSFAWFVGTVNDAAAEFGFRGVAEHEVDTLRGYDNRALMRHFGLPMWKVPLVARHMRRLQAEAIDTIRLFPGIEETLRDLALSGVSLAIVSSNSRANVTRVLGPESSARIDHFGCGASLLGKEARFKAVLSRSGTAPEHAIAIGDEIRDIEAAEGAGLAAGAVGWGYAHFGTLRARGPAEAFATVAEMRERLLGD